MVRQRGATKLFLENTDAKITLYLRKARRIHDFATNDRIRVVEGDVLDARTLEAAMAGQDVIYAISSMGIYGEAPTDGFGDALEPYRKAAEVIEGSDLDYTILRPAWLSNRDEIDYGMTEKGQPFRNPEGVVSRKSVADLVVKLAMVPNLNTRSSLGIHKNL